MIYNKVINVDPTNINRIITGSIVFYYPSRAGHYFIDETVFKNNLMKLFLNEIDPSFLTQFWAASTDYYAFIEAGKIKVIPIEFTDPTQPDNIVPMVL